MDVRSPSPTPPPPLVGCDRELSLLHDRLTATRGGRGSLVLIGGEAGIGKTALTSRLDRQATEAHPTIPRGAQATPPDGVALIGSTLTRRKIGVKYAPWGKALRGDGTRRCCPCARGAR